MFLVSKKRLVEALDKLADADRKLEVSEKNYKSLYDDYIKVKRDLDVAKSTVYKPVVGVLGTEVDKCSKDITKLYDDAHKRQKSKNAKPSDFMKGLEAALTIVKKLNVRELV